MASFEFIKDVSVHVQIILAKNELSRGGVLDPSLSLMLKFLNHAIKLINTERLFKDSHFFNEVNFLASSPKNFILVFVYINFEYVFRSIV